MDSTARPQADRLLAVIRDLSFCRTVQEVMDIVRREARQLIDADGVTFVLRDSEECYYAEESAIAPLWKGRRFPMKACISGWVMLNRQVAAIENIYEDPRIPTDAYRPTFVRSLAMVPVRESDPLGAIGAYWASNHRTSETELRILQSIAEASALALENVRLYDNLQKALDRAEALNRAKDEWISVLSHELRTPLTPILGWTKMLQAKQFDKERQLHALNVIERNVREEIRIVDDLLDVSRLMVGKARIEAAPCDVRAAVNGAVDAVRPDAERKGVELTAALPETEVTVLGDGERLQQAVWNLVDNAVKYTPAGGSVDVSLAEAEGQASVIVSDTGAGIAPDVLPRLFMRFERADSSMTRSDGGLGLGLFLVRRIAELHGGSVSASSDGPGQGAMFVLHLPLENAGRRADSSASVAGRKDLAGSRVLVVDDDEDAVDMVRHVLEASGADVVPATNVEQAIASCTRGRPFDAVVSDLAMPQQDGFRLLARIRALPAPASAVPVLALTAHASVEDARRALNAGFQQCIRKPIDPVRLADAVRALIDGRRVPVADPA